MGWNAHLWVKWNDQYNHTTNGHWKNWDWVKEWKPVKRAWTTMGDWDMCFEVKAETPEQLEDFVWNTVRKNPWVAQTSTTWTKEVWARN
ncbi:MAG: hypothetical protein A2284_04170 [Deltaproteobacteria bacterium RIFOXYA12_FULL_61_11]|nr:MAG: hypothetical protein A2284_04170 [Deltaproteobacteria bacterium RIFOXYA12_FULL_61_11]